jgi:hypothetical protein
MDLSIIESFIPDVAAWLNVQPSTLLLLWALLATGCNVASRLIPADSTGWLRHVRVVTGIIGVYVPSRITAGGITTEHAAAAIIVQAGQLSQAANQAVDRAESVLAEAADELRVPQEFHDFLTRQAESEAEDLGSRA